MMLRPMLLISLPDAKEVVWKLIDFLATSPGSFVLWQVGSKRASG